MVAQAAAGYFVIRKEREREKERAERKDSGNYIRTYTNGNT